MIIDNNNGNNQQNYTSNFNERLNTIKINNEKNQGLINLVESTRTNKYTDINNTDEMIDKSFAILQDRLANGTISMEEFNRQCRALGKIKNK